MLLLLFELNPNGAGGGGTMCLQFFQLALSP